MSASSFSSQYEPTSTLSSEIDSLSEHQLKRLTRSNTRRNLGTRRSRFMSQLERVCQHLDLLNITSDFITKTKALPQLKATPVVNPDGTLPSKTAENGTRGPTPFVDQEQTSLTRVQTPRISSDCTALFHDDSTNNSDTSELHAAPNEDEDFLIEPATDCTSTEAVSATTKSFRSVRISTTVTILDYCPKNKIGEPISLSVSTQHRTEHPNRNGRSLHLRRNLTEQSSFPRAMSSLERLKVGDRADPITVRHDNVESSSGDRSTVDCRQQKPLLSSVRTPKNATHGTKVSPRAAFATHSPNGAYGSRSFCNDQCDS